MTSFSAVLMKGRVRAGERDYVYIPSRIRGASKYGVILVHGAGTPLEYLGGGGSAITWASTAIAGRLATAGIPCIGAEMSGDSWANDASQTDMTAAAALLSSQAGCSSTKYHILAVSMGNLVASRWAAANPTKVASLTGIIPATHLKKIYDTNQAGLEPGIATAWGLAAARQVTDAATTNTSTTLTSATAAFVAGDVGKVVQVPNVAAGTTIVSRTSATQVVMSAAATATASGQTLRIKTASTSPMNSTVAWAPTILSNAIPSRYYYSTVDAIIAQADVTAWASAVGGTATQIDTSTGHSENTVQKFIDNIAPGSMLDYINWIKGLGA